MKIHPQTLVEQEVKMTLKEAKSAWKRNTKHNGTRMQKIGAPPDHYRGWGFTPPGNTFPMILLQHTRFLPSHVPPTEEPAWKVMLRFPSTPDEIKQGKGSTVDFTLKARFSSPDGEAGVQEAQVAAEKAWHTLKAKRESAQETKGQL